MQAAGEAGWMRFVASFVHELFEMIVGFKKRAHNL